MRSVVALLAASLPSGHAYKFMAIGDWGASYTPSGTGPDTCEITSGQHCSVSGPAQRSSRLVGSALFPLGCGFPPGEPKKEAY